MSGSVVKPKDLLLAPWRELRSEVCRWDSDDDDEVEGYDGFSRFWCPDAVFDIYWVAERISDSEAALYLTNDLLLTGFKAPLPFDAGGDYLVDLAKQIRWERAAATVLRSMVNKHG